MNRPSPRTSDTGTHRGECRDICARCSAGISSISVYSPGDSSRVKPTIANLAEAFDQNDVLDEMAILAWHIHSPQREIRPHAGMCRVTQHKPLFSLEVVVAISTALLWLAASLDRLQNAIGRDSSEREELPHLP